MMTLFDAIMLMSGTIELINPDLTYHNKRVAYIASKIAQKMSLTRSQHENVVISALIHDIGALSADELNAISRFDAIETAQHSEVGHRLLKNCRFTCDSAAVIRYHHLKWNHGKGAFSGDDQVPVESHIIHLADRIDTLIDPSLSIMVQKATIAEKISAHNGTWFKPEIVAAFEEVSKFESFWLDIINSDFEVRRLTYASRVKISWFDLDRIADIIKNVIDFKSPFTATHSSGVTAVAFALAQKAGLPDDLCMLVSLAGKFHDIGKLAVPNSIIEKQGHLTEDEYNVIKSHTYYTNKSLSGVSGLKKLSEWASLHHERIDGSGYPYHYAGTRIPFEARLMAAADIFTAMVEDSPYRKGEEPEKAIEYMWGMVTEGAMNEYEVGLLTTHLDEIYSVCMEAQRKALEDYRELMGDIDSIKQNADAPDALPEALKLA